jgi:hypothetical protein
MCRCDWLRAGRLDYRGFESRQGLGIFLFTTASRPALEPTQPPIQLIQGALSLVVKRPGREAHHSPPSSAEVKECVELNLHSLTRLHGVVLSLRNAQGQLYLYLKDMEGAIFCSVCIGASLPLSKADKLSSSCKDAKNAWRFTCIFLHAFMAWFLNTRSVPSSLLWRYDSKTCIREVPGLNLYRLTSDPG